MCFKSQNPISESYIQSIATCNTGTIIQLSTVRTVFEPPQLAKDALNDVMLNIQEYRPEPGLLTPCSVLTAGVCQSD